MRQTASLKAASSTAARAGSASGAAARAQLLGSPGHLVLVHPGNPVRTTATSDSSAHCGNCDICRNGHCNACSPDGLRIISGYSVGDRAFRAGQDLLSPGDACDSVFNLIEGWACLYTMLEDGQRQILYFALPGAVLGFNPNRRAAATFGVQALTNAVACVIPHSVLTSHLEKDPAVATRLAPVMSQDLNLVFDHVTNIARKSAMERVAHELLELYVRCRLQWPGNQTEEMELPLTQEHIGDALGLTPIHVNRVLCQLRERGIVELRYRRLRILHPAKLIEVAGLDPELASSWIRRGCACEGCETHGRSVRAIPA